jgi:Protein of unknown function (DUF2914)/Tetratricopeptide repeat
MWADSPEPCVTDMTHAIEPGSVLAAAEEAAETGDLETAERLLREALALQEAKLGLKHADLAETLNNLAVVCERQEKYADAEQNYRRAHAIAIAALKPGDPAVATSLKNLVEFCVSRGIPIWMPPAEGANGGTAAAQPAAPALDQAPTPAQVSSEEPAEAAAVASGPPARLIAIVALSAAAVLALLLFAWRGTGTTTERSPESTATTVPDRASAPSSTTAPTPAPPRVTSPKVQPPAPAPAATRRTEPAKVDAPAPRTNAAASTAAVTVLTASMCSAFQSRGAPDWQCTPAKGSAQPGTFTFYTRVRTATDTTIEHRWYRGDRLHQAVKLAVRANQATGYRTFSRATISPDRAGDWRVELRAADGTLLKEERLAVR